MTDTSSNNKRIAKNTMLLYFRMILTMLVTLYTSRVVLNTLGVEDFGIFNVVGGIVVMFSVLSGSLSAAISRFLTYEMGRNDFNKLKTVFSTSVSIQFVLAFIIIILAETIGLWFLHTHMNIPQERMTAATWTFHFSVMTFCINLISVPYNALIISHEKMNIYAYISILEAILKLVIVYLLVFSSYDKLILYSFLLFVVALFIRVIYSLYCRRNYIESKYTFVWNKKVFYEMFAFAGWNFIGSSSSVLSNQGVNILLNIFCGPIINASRGIAYQVSSAITSFSSNFMIALNPQITKQFASGDRAKMLDLIYRGSKVSFILLLILSLPLFFETHYILQIWLKQVPEYSMVFVQLVLVFAISEAFSGTLITGMLATGKIRNYQIIVGGAQMLNLPISYLFLKMGYSPISAFIIMIIISQLCLFLRLYMLKTMLGLSARLFLYKVYIPCISVAVISYLLLFVFSSFLDIEESILRLLIVGVISVLVTVPLILYIVLSNDERAYLFSVIRKKLMK